MIKYTEFGSDNPTMNKEYPFPKEIRVFSVTHIAGRTGFFVNGVMVFQTDCEGDYAFSVNNSEK